MANSRMKIGFRLRGFKEHAAMLEQLPARTQANVIVVAVGEAAKPLVRLAKANVIVRTGALKRSIIHVVRRYPRSGKVLAIIGPDAHFYRAGKRVRRGDFRGADKPSKYAHLVEFGYHVRKGLKNKNSKTVWVPAKSFLRVAVMQGGDVAAVAFERGVVKGLDREISKLLTRRTKSR